MTQPRQPEKLIRSSIYSVRGTLARYSGAQAPSGAYIFNAHETPICAPLSDVLTVTREDVQAYMSKPSVAAIQAGAIVVP